MSSQPTEARLPDAALLIIDVQNDYCHSAGAHGARRADLSMVPGMIENLALLTGAFRRHHRPVIHVRTLHDAATDSPVWKTRSGGQSGTTCRRGSWGAQFYEMKPADNDVVVDKHRYSAFIRTRLETVINALGVRTLVVGGISTNVCVESTVRDGFMLDYHVVLAHEACAAYAEEMHRCTLKNISRHFGSVADSADIVRML